MMNGKDKALGTQTPAIRFKEFSGEWLNLILGDISDIKTGPFGSSLHAEDYVENGEPIITTEHFKNGFLPSDKKGVPQVSYEDYCRLNSYILKLGDIVFSRVGSVDINAHVIHPQKGWLFSGRVLRVRTDSFIDSEYLHHELSTSRVKKSVISRAVGQTMPSINTEILRITPIRLPVKTKEQTKIGNYFQQLDTLIAQHQQKHDKLLNLKKALLEKMFPKQSFDVPEIRFKSFSGAWEEKYLGKITDYKNGSGHEDKQKTKGKYELVNLNSISIDGGLKSSGKFIDETESTLDKNDLVMILSDVAHGNLLGRVALIPIENTYVLNQRVALLRPTGDIFPLFVLYSINAHQSYFKAQGAGMSQLNISRSSVENFSLFIPEKKEQTKIGNLFKQLDTLINQHQIQLKKLGNIKQACLAKMFV